MDVAIEPDLTHQLARDLYYEVVHALRDALPPTSPELVREIVNGDSPILEALVEKPPHRLGAAT